jgi:hypothetical protein
MSPSPKIDPEIPRVLYKYRDLVGKNRGYVREILLEDKVYFSSFDNLNDPFDGRVHMSFKGGTREWNGFISRMTRLYNPKLTHKGLRAEVNRILRDEKRHKDPEVLKRGLSDAQQAFYRRWGIFCLSERNDVSLMWSHYADGHRGLCLGFAHLAVKPLGPALSVKYTSEFPKVNFFTDDDLRKFEAQFLTKGLNWEHESERRVIDRVGGPGIRHFPPKALVSVIFGAKMSQEDRAEVLSWVEQRSSKPNLFEAHLKEGTFDLDIRPWSSSP